MAIHTEHIHAFLNTSAPPPQFNHLIGLSLIDLDIARASLDDTTRASLLNWADIYKSTCELQRMGNITLISSPLLEEGEGDVTQVLLDVNVLFSDEAIEIDYAPALWEIRTRFLADLAAEGGNSCQSCARGVLVRKYSREVEELLKQVKVDSTDPTQELAKEPS